ncbi:MAG: Ig-like domain-containing domain, partial [Flavitalea sp.]
MHKMKLSYLFTMVVLSIICFATVTVPSGCASIVPPLGGPRDSLPPVLLNANPVDSTLHFTNKKVVLTFDEFIQLENVQQNLIVSPTPKINPIIDAKLRVVTINIKDTLQPNTTYSFNFGNSLKDVNEGNTLKNFTYLLSTGSYLDSLHLSGKVIIAETGKVDTTIIVMLYNQLNDSAVVKEKPRYITRIDSLGNFKFNNLAPATYAVYAIKDEAGARRYLSKTALFAFADSTVSSASQKSDIMLYAFEENDTTKAPSTIGKPNTKKPKEAVEKTMKIRSNLNAGQLDLLSNLEINFEPDSIISFDTTRAHFS